MAQWTRGFGETEFGGMSGGPTGSDAADLARRMRLVDPDDAGGWESEDGWHPPVRLR